MGIGAHFKVKQQRPGFRLKQDGVPGGVALGRGFYAIGGFHGRAPCPAFIAGKVNADIRMFFPGSAKPCGGKAVAGFHNGRVNIGDPTDPYYPLADERLVDEEDLEDNKDGDDESSDEDGEGKSSDEEEITVDKDKRGAPLYGRKLRILLGSKPVRCWWE